MANSKAVRDAVRAVLSIAAVTSMGYWAPTSWFMYHLMKPLGPPSLRA